MQDLLPPINARPSPLAVLPCPSLDSLHFVQEGSVSASAAASVTGLRRATRMKLMKSMLTLKSEPPSPLVVSAVAPTADPAAPRL